MNIIPRFCSMKEISLELFKKYAEESKFLLRSLVILKLQRKWWAITLKNKPRHGFIKIMPLILFSLSKRSKMKRKNQTGKRESSPNLLVYVYQPPKI